MSQVDSIPRQDVRCWLSSHVDDKRTKIRSRSVTHAQHDEAGGLYELANLTPKEIDAIESFLLGSTYLRVVDGRLHAYSAFAELPTAEADPIIAPHWESDGKEKKFGGPLAREGRHWPGISISGLGTGISSSPFGADASVLRERNQQKVVECGFECLRSRRGDCGRYWEQWVLHSLYLAKGPLKAHLDGLKDQKLEWQPEVEEACRFLARDLGVSFGSMDITIQRWALVYDD